MGRKTSTTPEQDLQILSMRNEGEMTFESISRKMGITISTARRAYQRAYQELTDPKEFKSNSAEKVMEYLYGGSEETSEIFESALTSGSIQETVSTSKNFFQKFFSNLFK